MDFKVYTAEKENITKNLNLLGTQNQTKVVPICMCKQFNKKIIFFSRPYFLTPYYFLVIVLLISVNIIEVSKLSQIEIRKFTYYFFKTSQS